MFPPSPPLWNGTSFLFLRRASPLPPLVERDILPSVAALVQFIYNYIGITIYVSPLPLVERDILPSSSASILKPENLNHTNCCLEPLRAQIIILPIAYDVLKVILIIRVSTKNHTKYWL